MLGERYFTTRERLAALVLEVRALAAKSGSEENLQDGSAFDFLTPFTLLACGGINSGKSTFLNAIFGKNYCKTSHLPETKTFLHYSYHERKSTTQTEHSFEYHLPDPLLKNYNLIDSPGSETLNRKQEQYFDDLVTKVDLVFFLFPASNPWAANTWDLLARLPEKQQSKAVLILQQADQTTPEDLNVIMDHMANLADQKIGRRPRIFPVSAKQCVEAKEPKEMVRKIWHASGYPELEKYLDDQINYHPARRRILREVCGLLRDDLQIVEAQIEELTHQVATEKSYLTQLEDSQVQLRNQQIALVDDDFSELGEAYERACATAQKDLHRRLSLKRGLLSLFQEESVPQEVDKVLTNSTHDEIGDWATQDSKRLAQLCRAHWQETAPLIKDRLDITPPDFEKGTGSLTEARGHFNDLLRRNARLAISDLKLRSLLDFQLETRRSGFRRYVGVILAAITLMGISGALGIYSLVSIFLGIVILFGIGATVFNAKSRKEICRIFHDCVGDCRKPFTKSMNKEYRDTIHHFFSEYGQLLGIVRRYVAKNQAELAPQSQEWNDLFLKLRSIEQSL